MILREIPNNEEEFNVGDVFVFALEKYVPLIDRKNYLILWKKANPNVQLDDIGSLVTDIVDYPYDKVFVVIGKIICSGYIVELHVLFKNMSNPSEVYVENIQTFTSFRPQKLEV